MSACSANIVGKISPTKRTDPCPPVGKGTYKVANVCKSSPYVFYTPRQSKPGFRESIQDLTLLNTFNKDLRKFFMIPKCVLEKGVPGKTEETTVVVSKLTSLLDYMERKAEHLLETYIDFTHKYLKAVLKTNPQDIWQVVSMDFKPDNLMVNGRTGKMYITDFSPMREHKDGRYSYVTTPLYVLGDDFSDYKINKKYSALEISQVAWNAGLLCILTSLYHLICIRNHLATGVSPKTAEDLGFDQLERLFRVRARDLASRQKNVMKALRNLHHTPVDMDIVESWLTMKPFGRRTPLIVRARTAKKNRKEPQSQKSKSRSASKPDCKSFLSGLKRSSVSKVVNPLTNRMIMKRGADGKPTALVKKILKHCGQ